MKKLLKEMVDPPLDANNRMVPPKHRERWLALLGEMLPRTPLDLSPDELREAWSEDLAAWWEGHMPVRAG